MVALIRYDKPTGSVSAPRTAHCCRATAGRVRLGESLERRVVIALIGHGKRRLTVVLTDPKKNEEDCSPTVMTADGGWANARRGTGTTQPQHHRPLIS